MCRSITWTDDSEEHIARHNVSPGEVEDVLFARPRLKKRGKDGTMLFYGRTRAGRPLFVVTSEHADGGTFIVTARRMTPSEQNEFNKNAR